MEAVENTMNREHLCTEEEAAHIAGVSPRTLLRFSEAGYLTIHAEPNGARMFERSQVQEIFGLASQSMPAHHEGPLTAPSTLSPTFQPCSSEIPATDTGGVSDQSELSPPPGSESGQRNPLSHRLDTTPQAASDEIARLRNLLALQERILDSKDDEIADLRNQRTWLRERIEKLEEKSDRDQILLLSETQMIRSLISYQESRKSTLRQLLEWVGVVRDEARPGLPQPQQSDYQSQQSKGSPSSRTIEVAKTANSDY